MKIILTIQEVREKFNLPEDAEIEIQSLPKVGDVTTEQEYFTITDDGKLKTSEILNKCREKFDVWSYWDDKKLDKDFPAPKKATTRKFKKVIEADEELKNKSADDLEKEGIQGITLRERLLMELAYFEETGNHLDVENVTLCSGSRCSDGNVPSVSWGADDRELYVGWCNPSASYSNLRARAAVTL